MVFWLGIAYDEEEKYLVGDVNDAPTSGASSAPLPAHLSEARMIRAPLCLRYPSRRCLSAIMLVATLLGSIGCRHDTTETSDLPDAASIPKPEDQGAISSALDALKEGASRVQKAVEPYASPIQSTAVESVQKMLAIEYRIVEVTNDESADAIEMQLKEVGVNRWDCSPMPSTASHTRFLCKRLPMTSYLKAISLLTKLTPE